MKRIYEIIAAVFCAFMIALSGTEICSAAEEQSEYTLPSGKTTESFARYLTDYGNCGFDDEETDTEMEFASASVGVFKGNEILYTGYFGETDLENHIDADENSVYEWGSISKVFVWVSVMQLWEQGKIDLDRDIRDYLPHGFLKRLKYNEPVTMINLMNHTGGWEESQASIFRNAEDSKSLASILQNIEPEQTYRPGEVHSYSNFGATLAGYIVECISGTSYCDYVHENILDVLGMKHTSVSSTRSDNRFVYENIKNTSAYSFILGISKRIDIENTFINIYPAGAMAGTLSDLMIFAQALADDSSPIFTNPETQKVFLSGTLFYGDSDIPINSHGLFWKDCSVRVFGHNGATKGCLSNMMIDPVSKVGLVTLVNEPNGNWFYNNTEKLVFGKPEYGTLTGETLKTVNAGRFYKPARSIGSGMWKFTSILSVADLGSSMKIADCGDSRCIFLSNDNESVMTAGIITLDDGNTGFRTPSTDYLPVRAYSLKIFLLAAYIILAVISVVMILTLNKLKKYGKLQYAGGYAIKNAGYAARLLSVIIFFSVFCIYMNNYGIPKMAEVLFGVLQILCAVVCILSTVMTVAGILRKNTVKTKMSNIWNVVFAAGNILTAAAIVYFELYKFI